MKIAQTQTLNSIELIWDLCGRPNKTLILLQTMEAGTREQSDFKMIKYKDYLNCFH